MTDRKLKTKLHFNRVNMVRGKDEVWTAHNSHGCFQGEKLVIRHNGVVVAGTIFNPKANRPRGYFVAAAAFSLRLSAHLRRVAWPILCRASADSTRRLPLALRADLARTVRVVLPGRSAFKASSTLRSSSCSSSLCPSRAFTTACGLNIDRESTANGTACHQQCTSYHAIAEFSTGVKESNKSA